MKIKTSSLERVAVEKKQYPSEDMVEIAFAGRSNVGKSSFINSILNRKNLARTSGTPGKTRTINFYLINEEFRLVDLPGYGYAVASKKDLEKWADIINKYLHNRPNLKEIFLLVDIRHEPSKQDVMMYDWIRSCGFKGVVIATKSDKVSKSKMDKNISIIKKTLKMEQGDLVIPYSSVKKDNISKVWSEIESIINI